MNLRAAWPLLKETFSEWSDDNASRLAAALAYYTIFSLAPIVIITISIVGLVLGEEAARGQIDQQIAGLIGPEAARGIEDMVSASSDKSSGILAGALGLLALLFGATGVFSELHNAMNTIWDVESRPQSTVMGFVKTRLLSFTVVLGIGFLLLVSLVISAGLAAAGTFVSSLLPGSEVLWHAVQLVVSLGVITLLFAMMFKILPDVQIAWRDVWIGALATSILFTAGKFLIGFYLGASAVASSYGAAGALVLVLVWVYYSAQILFLGAEFTQVYARRYGSRIVPDKDAVPLDDTRRRQHGLKPAAAPARTPVVRRPIGSAASVLFGILIGLALRVFGRRARSG